MKKRIINKIKGQYGKLFAICLKNKGLITLTCRYTFRNQFVKKTNSDWKEKWPKDINIQSTHESTSSP